VSGHGGDGVTQKGDRAGRRVRLPEHRSQRRGDAGDAFLEGLPCSQFGDHPTLLVPADEQVSPKVDQGEDRESQEYGNTGRYQDIPVDFLPALLDQQVPWGAGDGRHIGHDRFAAIIQCFFPKDRISGRGRVGREFRAVQRRRQVQGGILREAGWRDPAKAGAFLANKCALAGAGDYRPGLQQWKEDLLGPLRKIQRGFGGLVFRPDRAHDAIFVTTVGLGMQVDEPWGALRDDLSGQFDMLGDIISAQDQNRFPGGGEDRDARIMKEFGDFP